MRHQRVRLLLLSASTLSLHDNRALCTASQPSTPPPATKPACIATWRFGSIAVDTAASLLSTGASALDACERGINQVETDTREQYYVGVGGLPNSAGVMEFDAALMDHTLRYSAVLALPDIATPVSVARSLLDHSAHNVLVGQGALAWALSRGFAPSQVLTPEAEKEWRKWREDGGLAAIAVGAPPPPSAPLSAPATTATTATTAPSSSSTTTSSSGSSTEPAPPHDTIGLICLDARGHLCCGASTSGWKFKHPGRVGDSALPGSGLYCDGNVGACVCTGDGEELQRSCTAFLVVELMRGGMGPGEACREAVGRISKLAPKHTRVSSKSSQMYPALTVAVIAMDVRGRMGAASTIDGDNKHRGADSFPAAFWRAGGGGVGDMGGNGGIGGGHGAGAMGREGGMGGAGGAGGCFGVLEASREGAEV